jgi:hypothetical protein
MRIFLGVWEFAFIVFLGLFFLVFDSLYFVGAVFFSFKICLQQLLTCEMHQKEGFKFFWNTKNNKALLLDLACPKCINVQSLAGLLYARMKLHSSNFVDVINQTCNFQ